MSDLAVQNRESEQEVMPSFDFLLERETERNTLLAEHRAWLKEIKRERPLPKTHYRVAVYIRYFNQTRYEVFMANVEAGNQEQLMIKDLVESYSLSIGQVRNYGVVCAVSTLENIYERFGYHVLDRTLRLCVGTWEGDMNSLSANMLNGIARLVYTFGDALKDETFKEKVGEMSVKLLSRTAKERRPGSMGYAEAMLLAYNRKCKYPLKWTRLYEKNVGNNEGLDIDTDMDEDEGGDSFEGVAKE